MKKLAYFLLGALFFSSIAYAAPNVTYQTNLLPTANDTYDLGSTTPALEWLHGYFKSVCISGTCMTSWPGSSSFGTTSISALLPLVWNTNTAQLSTLFSTTSTWGIGNNQVIYTSPTGVPLGIATSSASFSIGGTALNVTGVVALPNGGTGLNSINGNSIIYTNNSGTAFVTTSTSTLSIGGNAATATVLSPGATINGVLFTGGSNITVASTTLLANNNTFLGTNIFNVLTVTGNTTLTNATTTDLFSTIASSTNLYSQLAQLGMVTVNNTLTIPNLGTAAGSFIAVNAQGQIIATTTPSGGGAAFPFTPTSYGVSTSTPIGIATTSPTAFQVLDGYGTQVLNVQTSSTTGDILDVASSTGTVLLNVTQSGNVGISTSTPGTPLGVQGSAEIAGNITASGVTATTTLTIPNSSNPSPTVSGQVTQSTNAPYQIHTGNNAAGTTVFDPRTSFTFGIATTTSWTGTTTAPLVVIPTGLTWNTVQCATYPFGSSLEVSYQYNNPTGGLILPTMFQASSTIGLENWYANNTPAASATSTINFGNPANSPTSVSCTLTGVVTGI